MNIMTQQVVVLQRWFCVILILFLFHTSQQNNNNGRGGGIVNVHALIEIRVVENEIQTGGPITATTSTDDDDSSSSKISSSTTTMASSSSSSAYSYSIIDYSTGSSEKKNTTLFEGGDIAVFMEGKWCVSSSSSSSTSSTAEDSSSASTINKLIPSSKQNIHGYQKGLGSYHGIEIVWYCYVLKKNYDYDDDDQQQEIQEQQQQQKVPIKTKFKNFDSGLAVLFELEWPNGASNTKLANDDDPNQAMTNFPCLKSSAKTYHQQQPSILSWHGSFIQSIHNYSIGPTGGPTVFYNSSDPNLQNVIVGSPFSTTHERSNNDINYWKTFTAGNNQDWSSSSSSDSSNNSHNNNGDNTTVVWWSPGTSGRIKNIPKGFKQSILLYQGTNGGITSTLEEWGNIMKLNSRSQAQAPQVQKEKKKLHDITLEKVGYQTDNGAMYCFCNDKNCSKTIIDEMHSLRESMGISMGYLSFQGAGTSKGRGQAAPWCVETWGVDPGGLNPNHYPLSIKDMQSAINLPLQLYAPYFCPNSTYFNNNNNTTSRWISVQSDTSLPGCQNFQFENVIANQSYEFYNWFFQKGISNANMISFESDFMNQNFNCVPDFIHTIEEDEEKDGSGSGGGADRWLNGMSSAAYDNNITIQWCYATPTDVLSSLDMPSVTNFRVSYDYCYGKSWDIGESSLLVWVLGGKPSKDTLWTTTNNHTETPGCPWTLDHELYGIELHVILALMSTGPVGISDAIGMTNTTLLNRTIRMDGTLLQPSKPITAVDSTFIKKYVGGLLLDDDDDDDNDERGGGGGYLYGTAGCFGHSWIFVSFKMKESYGVTLNDFWPPPVVIAEKKKKQQSEEEEEPPPQPVVVLAYRQQFDDGIGCQHGTDAVLSGCIQIKSIKFDNDDDVLAVEEDAIKTISSKSQHQQRPQEEDIFVVPASDTSSPGFDFAPTITYVWKETICDDSSWFFLGELNKYVPVSKNRFTDISCGVSSSSEESGGSGRSSLFVTIMGSFAETVYLTVVQVVHKRGRTFPPKIDDEGRYKVVCKEVQFPPHSRMIQVEFEDDGAEETVKTDVGFTKRGETSSFLVS